MKSRFSKAVLAVMVSVSFVKIAAAAPAPKSAKANVGKEIKWAPIQGVQEKLKTAKKGGTEYLAIYSNPKVMNPLLSTDTTSQDIEKWIWARLLNEDSGNLSYMYYLADGLTISADKKDYTFTLNPEAKWEDGTPVTTDDVKFTFDTMMNPKVDAAAQRAYWVGVTLEVKDPRTFTFNVPNPQFDTLRSLGYFTPIQKKQFANEADFNKAKGILNPIGNGPYKFKSFSRDQKVELERNKDWWGSKLPSQKNLFNADLLVLRVIPDVNLTYERFVKGDIDAMAFDGSKIETYVQKVKGADKDKFGTKANSGKPLWTTEINNKAPRQYSFVGWNLRKPWFMSKKTRQALARTVDVKEISDKVYYGYAIQTTSPFGSKTENSDQSLNKPGKRFDYDPKKAAQLLKEDGWADTDKDNVLDKMIDGKKVAFRFELKTNSNNPARVKIAQILKENLRKVGIDMNIRQMEWNSLITDLDNRNFDAMIMGWRPTPSTNPRQEWHTDSEKNQGSNFVAYSNKQVDELIGKANLEFDLAKRAKILQELNRIIYDDQPYLFLTELRVVPIGLNQRVRSEQWAMEYEPEVSYELFQY